MSNQKMREALTYIEGLAMSDDARDMPTIAEVACEALAQPAEVVELTDEGRKNLLATIKILSALESWSMANGKCLPEYLKKDLDMVVENLSTELLR